MSSRADLNFYVNFALHAVYGKLGEADTIMRFAGDAVRLVADELVAAFPIGPAPVYRGMLLDPDGPEGPFAPDPACAFLSWSEDPDVAAWFACARSVVSEPLAQLNPRLRGYVVSLPTPSSRVLFHHSWASALGGLACFALIHPHMGEEGKRQVEWALRTQREVITEPVADLRPERAADLDADALEALERRLSPPWVVTEEGARR